MTELLITLDDLILEPSCADFLGAFENLMSNFDNIVLTMPVFLSDAFFDPFTE